MFNQKYWVRNFFIGLFSLNILFFFLLYIFLTEKFYINLCCLLLVPRCGTLNSDVFDRNDNIL